MANAAEALNDAIPNVFTGDAHALLMSIYKNPVQPIELRLEAAKAAIRFEKPALATVDLTSQNTHVLRDVSDEPLTDEEWAERHVTTH